LTTLMELIMTKITNIATITSAMAAKPIPTACNNAIVMRLCSYSVSADLGATLGPDRPDCITGAPPGTKKGSPETGLPLAGGAYGFR
jgi:hypothetical protein